MEKKIHIRHKGRIALILIIIILIVAFVAYRMTARFNMVDHKVFKANVEQLDASINQFKSSDDFANYIMQWSQKHGLTPVKDDSGNIIITKPAANDAVGRPNTVICADYDYNTIKDRTSAISVLQYIAEAENTGGSLNVIFLNNDENRNSGIRNISSSYFPQGSDVFYLSNDEEDSYSSRTSFAGAESSIHLGAAKTNRTCDTLIRIKISGITSTTQPGTASHSQPDPVDQLDMILTKLKKGSKKYEIAGIKFDNHGDLYSTGMTVDLLMNSYDVDSMQKYLDKRSKKFVKAHDRYFPDIKYSYKIIKDENQLPDQVYDETSINNLSTLLYTIKNGSYVFDDTQKEQEKALQIHTYGRNNITTISASDSAFDVGIVSCAYNKKYLDQILSDNSSAAAFSNASFNVNQSTGRFENKSTRLSSMLSKVYTKVNVMTTRNGTIAEDDDLHFTPCSFIVKKNDDLNVLHIALTNQEAMNVTNVLLNNQRLGTDKWL